MPTTKPNRRLKPAHLPPQVDHKIALARRLALLADLHLQQGLHGSAELLAKRAETMREAGR